ncbi:NACHT domain-containing protein [Stackebrandtia nassauensis]|uniref:Putative signal transduction protein with Nacht domain n=1 Tax=Stackebrandtia nassauensis (strain DSM 44728 / CIP 108903 / NRRL B-16338 / NBRC 102104 / LLR-40K-21) TaxID=446470 RepID=D3PX82_STANL|nr:NACHT domain-containing protein [Stackebrandtia nassauensis]ADD41345.1 putative signal transduction protein with Nacht domain [Stackebrandtia nassauensis DSM 44728]
MGLLLLTGISSGAIILTRADVHPLWIIPATLALLGLGRIIVSRIRRRYYLRQLTGYANRVPLAGAAGLRLTDVYIDIGVKPADGPQAAERPFVGTDRHADRRTPLLSALRRRHRGPIVILGEPGSGKTTVLHRSAVELAKLRRGKRRIPVLIELGTHAARLAGDNAPNLAQLAAESGWLRHSPARWFARQLSAGRCVVMLDGLDETASQSQRRAVADWIAREHKRHSRNTFLVTTRPNGLTPDPLPHSRYWQLRHLTDSQIAAFLHDWCEAVESRKSGHTRQWVRDGGAAEAGVLLSRLRSQPAMHDLCAHPLPLTLIALVHRHCGMLPHDRAALYTDAVNLLVRTNAELVHALARQGMATRSRHLDATDVHAVDPEADAGALLDAGTRSGWLVRTAAGGFAFTHLSLQQFLAGRDLPEAEILSRTDDPWWRDAILLWAARANVTRVIDTCLRSGSIAALALAFDAAEAAGELEPETLAELRELLTLATKTPDENRMVGAVKVSRELSDMAPLFGGGRLAVRPVSNSLYSSFLEAEFPAGRPPPDASEQSAAVGIWPSEATRFLGWINGLPRADDTRFRLPTESELLAPQCRPRIEGRSVWVAGGAEPRLAHFGDTRDPYTVDRNWWQRVAWEDRRRVTLSLYLLAMVLGNKARQLSRDMAGEMNLDRARAFELPRELKKDTALADCRRYLKHTSLTPADTEAEARPHLDHVIDLLAELSAKALDFRGDRDASERANLPFTYLDRLTGDQRHLLSSAVTTLWFSSPTPPVKVKYGATLSLFDEYLARGIIDAGERRARTVPPERLLTALGEANHLLAPDTGDSVWLDLAATTLARVTDRLSNSLSHNTSYTVDDVSCARIAVTAVAAVVTAHPSPGPILEELSTVLAGLTVLEDRASGVLVPNEVLLLARS